MTQPISASQTQSPSGGLQVEDFLQAIVAGLMVVCVMLSVVALVHSLVPGWRGEYLAPLCGVATVEGFYSQRLLAAQSRLSRLIELAALFLALQIGLDLASGSAILEGGLPRFDGGAALAFIPVLLSWTTGSSLSALLAVLRVPHVYRPPGAVPPLRILTGRFFWGGILLFAAAALSQPNVAHFLHLPHIGAPGPVMNVLLYFLLGTLLLAQVRYSTLQQRWRAHGVTITGALRSHWLRYTLIFVAAVALLALLLPSSRTADALIPGRDALTGVVDVMRGPFTWLIRLFGHTAQHPITSPLPKVTPPPYLHGPTPHLHRALHHSRGSGSAFTVTRAAAFWLLILAALVYLLRTYHPRRPAGMRMRDLSLPRFFGVLWNSLRHLLGRYRERIGLRLPARIASMAVSLPPAVTHLHVPGRNVLTTREQVQRYFLNIVKRAERQGLVRRGSQTPHEYATGFGRRLPEVGEDMTALTDAFLEARYSTHGIEEREVQQARGHWQRVRTALGRLSSGL